MATASGHIISLNRLDSGKHRFEFDLDTEYFAAIEHAFVSDGQIHVAAELTLRERDYDLYEHVYGSVEVACDRCLGPMDISVDNEDTITAEPLGTNAADNEIDLAWLAYELITVNLPTVHYHPEGECRPEMAELLKSMMVADVNAEE